MYNGYKIPDALAGPLIACHMVRAAVDAADVARLAALVRDGKASLWRVPGRGLLLIGVLVRPGARTLMVYAAAGRAMYDADGMTALRALAAAERCERIVAKTDSLAVARLMGRLGFSVYDADAHGYLWLRTDILTTYQSATLPATPQIASMGPVFFGFDE